MDADPRQVTEADVARKVEEPGYTVVATEAQQYETDEALFATIRRRGLLAMGLAVADLAFDPLDVVGVPDRIRTVVSGLVARPWGSADVADAGEIAVSPADFIQELSAPKEASVMDSA